MVRGEEAKTEITVGEGCGISMHLQDASVLDESEQLGIKGRMS